MQTDMDESVESLEPILYDDEAELMARIWNSFKRSNLPAELAHNYVSQEFVRQSRDKFSNT